MEFTDQTLDEFLEKCRESVNGTASISVDVQKGANSIEIGKQSMLIQSTISQSLLGIHMELAAMRKRSSGE